MIYLISIFVILISYHQFKIVSGTMALNRINLMSIIFYFYLIFMSYLGAIFIASGFQSDTTVLSHVSNENKILGWEIISYILIAFPLGSRLAMKLFKIKNVSKLLKNYTAQNLVPVLSSNDSYMRLMFYFLSIISLLAIVYMIVVTGSIPQKQLFSLADQVDVLLMRNSINREFQGIYYVKSILFEKLTPILSLISFSYWQMTKKRSHKIWFFIMFLATLFVLTFNLSKSPLIIYGIIILILKIYLEGKIKWKYLILTFMFVIIVLFVMFLLVARNSELSFIFKFLFNRLFFDQVSGTFLMLEIFPKTYDFIGFSSMSRPISDSFLGGYSKPATRIAMEFAFPIASEKGIMNLLSTLFVGEAWANFGWFGVLLSPIYIGFLFGVIYFKALTSRKTPLMVSFLAYCSFGLSITTQFNNYIYNSVMFIIVFILVGSYIYALLLKQIKG